MDKYLVNENGKIYGKIGKDIGYNDFKIGDVVRDVDWFENVIVEVDGKIAKMGRMGKSLSEISPLTKIVDSKYLTQEIINMNILKKDYLTIKTEDELRDFAKEMTLEEIEKELGYMVKIVKQK